MRPSILLTSAFAFLAGATPQLLARATKSPCRKAVEKGAKPRVDCSSYLRTTVTPCPTTKVTTTTSTSTITKNVVSGGSISTTTSYVNVWEAKTVTQEVHASVAGVKRAAPTCPFFSKPTNIPRYARSQCNSKQYATACSNMGVKRKTATVAAQTVMNTKTATTSKTVTNVVVISPTATVTVTATTTRFGGTTYTAFTAPTQSCFLLSDSSTNKEIKADVADPMNVKYELVASGGGSKFSLTDKKGQYGYLFTGPATSQVFGRTNSEDWYFTREGEYGLDVLGFTTGFYPSFRTLICEINTGALTCSSKTLGSKPARTKSVACQIADPVDATKMHWVIAFTASDYTSKYCTPLALKTTAC